MDLNTLLLWYMGGKDLDVYNTWKTSVSIVNLTIMPDAVILNDWRIQWSLLHEQLSFFLCVTCKSCTTNIINSMIWHAMHIMHHLTTIHSPLHNARPKDRTFQSMYIPPFEQLYFSTLCISCCWCWIKGLLCEYDIVLASLWCKRSSSFLSSISSCLMLDALYLRNIYAWLY